VRFADGTHRGYTTVELTPSRCTARMRVVGSLADPATGVRTLATWTVADGRPGAQRES
jgi:phosphodiesterase/alkaline phosphatase D-like protein